MLLTPLDSVLELTLLLCRNGVCPLMLAHKLRQKECLQVLIHEGKADTSVLNDNSILARLGWENDNKREDLKKDTQCFDTGPDTNILPKIRFPNITQKPNELPDTKFGSFGENQSEMLDSVIEFRKHQERLKRKRKHKKKKKTTTVHINMTSEQYSDQNQTDCMSPNMDLIASGSKYSRPQKLTTHVTYTTSPLPAVHSSNPLPIRHLENDDKRFHRLEPPLYKCGLLSRSESRISVLKAKPVNTFTQPNFGSTREMRMTRDKPTDIPTSFAVDTAHEAKSPPLNKFTPLPPIFVNSRSAQVKKKELNLPNLHHQE